MTDADPGRLQRRSYFRMPVRFPMTVSAMMETGTGPRDAASHSNRDTVRRVIRTFRVLDISAGGCLCEDPDHFLEVGSACRITLRLNDREKALDLLARVVRRHGGNAGLSFEEISERDRGGILRSLFREYRRSRSPETRCCGED